MSYRKNSYSGLGGLIVIIAIIGGLIWRPLFLLIFFTLLIPISVYIGLEELGIIKAIDKYMANKRNAKN